MTISKRINDRRKMKRSKKGGEGPRFNTGPQGNMYKQKHKHNHKQRDTAPSDSIQQHIIVILSKLAGNVPAKANELSAGHGNAPIYFGWCPFNVREDVPYDLIKNRKILNT